MFVQSKTALAIAFLAIVPLHLSANTQRPLTEPEPLSARDVRKAEAQAKTAADHLRLAAWYRSEAEQAQANLKEQEALAKYWGQNPAMAARTKIPNPLWNAQARARICREKLQKATKLAADHRRMAESLQ